MSRAAAVASPPDSYRGALAARAGIGVTAGVVQRTALRFSRLVIDRPALILLRHGMKTLRSADGEWSLRSGEVVAIAGGQTFDVTNRLSGDGLYEARWLVWDPVDDRAEFEQGMAEGPALVGAAVLGRIEAPFASAFDRAVEAILDTRQIPDPVATHRLAEVLVWLAQAWRPLLGRGESRRVDEGAPAVRECACRALDYGRGCEAASPSARRLCAGAWRRKGPALATFCRRPHVRCRSCCRQPIRPSRRIALESATDLSRFAIRFRERFGFASTAIRGHARAPADLAGVRPDLEISGASRAGRPGTSSARAAAPAPRGRRHEPS